MHGACGCSQARAAGVLKFLTGLQQGLVPHHAQAFDFFVKTIGIIHAPRPGDQLRGDFACVGNGDAIGECVEITCRIRLLRQIVGRDFNLELVIWHERILNENLNQTRERAYVFKGKERFLCPVSLKMAFATAGAKGGTAGSPTPSGERVLGTIHVSTRGDCAILTKG